MSPKKELEDEIRKLRIKKTVCICIIVYAALCVLAFHSFTSIAVGLIVIAVAAVKLKKYNEGIKTGERLLNTVEWFEEVEHNLGIKYEEEYDDPNATYSAADLLGTSSDDEDDAGEEEYDDPSATYSTADLLGTSSSMTTKKTKNTKTTKTTKTRKPRK